MNETVEKIIKFLTQIGLAVEERIASDNTFLPGITVVDGVLVVDHQGLKYPGDLLHEAGHLAVLSTAQRENASDDFGGDGGNEMAAIAWSYAACVHLGLPLQVVFHEGGFKGDSVWFAETFSDGKYIGLPILEWKGMTSTSGDTTYPRMRHWLCQ